MQSPGLSQMRGLSNSCADTQPNFGANHSTISMAAAPYRIGKTPAVRFHFRGNPTYGSILDDLVILKATPRGHRMPMLMYCRRDRIRPNGRVPEDARILTHKIHEMLQYFNKLPPDFIEWRRWQDASWDQRSSMLIRWAQLILRRNQEYAESRLLRRGNPHWKRNTIMQWYVTSLDPVNWRTRLPYVFEHGFERHRYFPTTEQRPGNRHKVLKRGARVVPRGFGARDLRVFFVNNPYIYDIQRTPEERRRAIQRAAVDNEHEFNAEELARTLD